MWQTCTQQYMRKIVDYSSLCKYIARKQFDWLFLMTIIWWLCSKHTILVYIDILLGWETSSFILLGGGWGTLGGAWGTLGGAWGTLGGCWGTLGGCWGTLGGGWGTLGGGWCLVIGGYWCLLGRLDGLLLRWVCPLLLHDCDTGHEMTNFRKSVLTLQWSHRRSLNVVWYYGWSLVVRVSYCRSLDEPDDVVLRSDHFNVLHESSLCDSDIGREVGPSVGSL